MILSIENINKSWKDFDDSLVEKLTIEVPLYKICVYLGLHPYLTCWLLKRFNLNSFKNSTHNPCFIGISLAFLKTHF